MNWKRLYAATQIWFVVCLMSVASSGLYSVVAIGVCRKILSLDANSGLLWVGVPSFIALFAIHIRLLPKCLRKAGMLSDEPEKFGPWFK
ncbi:hypothetical protein LIG30_4837 [Burkholderia sp. lig30]|jgi:hypothetical protein|nr:hypothetical protein LIG30_4837 [Burkholderia sp. lig30]